ncbi:MAG: phosphoribosylaminoimidazolesuccinocarboxamide synthase [Candidatus Aquicultor secundus]|uniref:Phosphoribosylaminoimidazole-succinocarboxamide synthase n=1 Tax=Candidatus Aquicultor secundus TaxID=1973895 RepID=A0A2M7T720_9ACTN|nr:phosphoribosylaminoimidazolesuccinocarboxamide synthase [Candidatus Aquicultor secundus]NCO65506.1 phosphoribosylaminoimidazolesuccinocarboxamide synthase [Solirubrobacter sp.]OIO83947.1 MAG: phosphoribosylaminoimidazolesuccinocarboxamide synthase [Candidatus Aquicultor secundus]PIU26302.1 MAG: phosphoribosylaminoimidazolesuccinocarboxamide synthase [Candidatus Aquicultor secundus]PIW22358.1 MAG: phosphoribosylaminoimidazolesuccinocarboxamide synthase [Candidatus Aquicultor secundus]PIX5149
MVQKQDQLYEGKAKKLYSTDDPSAVIHEFKDDATAFDGKKKGQIAGKGSMNARISAALFTLLENQGVRTHYRELINDRTMLTDKLDMVPVEVVVRNIAAGSLSKRLGYDEGVPLKNTIVEFYYKRDDLGDPMINEDHIAELGIATKEQIKEMRETGLKVNDVLVRFFDQLGLTLVDYKLEFGLKDGVMMLGDELSPDNCRLWDKKTGEKMDKDRFRRDLGRVEEAYREVLARVTGTSKEGGNF